MEADGEKSSDILLGYMETIIDGGHHKHRWGAPAVVPAKSYAVVPSALARSRTPTFMSAVPLATGGGPPPHTTSSTF